MSADQEPEEAPAAPAAKPRVSLRALYKSALGSVQSDPAAALADYQAFLAELVEARRKREA